jgi:diketogulonate reductase-like aldo/keto reductase
METDEGIVDDEGLARAIGVCNFHRRSSGGAPAQLADRADGESGELHPLLSQAPLRSFWQPERNSGRAYSPRGADGRQADPEFRSENIAAAHGKNVGPSDPAMDYQNRSFRLSNPPTGERMKKTWTFLTLP